MAAKLKDFKISDESIDMLASKIHQFEFVDLRYKLQVYSCRSCNNVAIRHRIANCNDIFCQECYGLYHQRPCPVCKTVITESIQDDDFMKTILQFKVCCEFKNNGCQTVVSLEEFLGHIKDCRLATKRLLPKVYKSDPQTEALEQINANFQEVKNMMEVLQAENKQLRNVMVEIKEENKNQMTRVTQELKSKLGEIQTENKTQFTDVKATINNQERKITQMKKDIDAIVRQIPLVCQELQNQHETAVATMENVTTMDEKLGQIKSQNGDEVKDIKESTKKLEKDNVEIKKIIDDLALEIPRVQDKLNTCVTTTGQVTKLTNEFKSNLGEMRTEHNKQNTAMKKVTDGIVRELQNQHKTAMATKENVATMDKKLVQIKSQNEDTFKKIKETTNKLEKDNVEMRKVMDVLHKNHQETAMATNEQLTTLSNDLLSLSDGMETHNKIQIAYRQSKSTKFVHFYRNYLLGETIPRDLNAEDDSSDLLDTMFTWTIRGVREKIKHLEKWRDVFAESEEFSIPSRGLKFRANLRRSYNDESLMRIRLDFTRASSATSPFLHSRKYVLVDQSNDRGNQNVEMLDQPLFGQNSTEQMMNGCFCYCNFFSIRWLRYRAKYIKNDEMLIRITLEPIATMFKRVPSMDGTLLLRINNFEKRKRESIWGIRQQLTSESFYTGVKGLRMDMEIHLNGIGINEGKGISIRPVFRIGEWDDSHSYPIKFKYARFLMDQSDVGTKREKSFQSGIIEWESYYDSNKFVDFISNEDVEHLPYLKDDALLIKFVVEISDTPKSSWRFWKYSK